MKLKLALSTATALGLLAGAAYAGGSNEAYTKQDGEDNILVIEQAKSSSNRVGTELNPILQKGDENQFREMQSPGTAVGNGNIIDAGAQYGKNNRFRSDYSNNAAGNWIGSTLQRGDDNTAAITRNGQKNGVIGTIIQGAAAEPDGGNKNRLSIDQSGSDTNTVTLARQIGSGNGGANISPQNRNDWGTYIVQRGSGNIISEASILGSDNKGQGGRAVLDILQRGTGNVAYAVINGSVGNQIVLEQAGLGGTTDATGGQNVANLETGTGPASTGNTTRAYQYGTGNDVYGRQNGDNNTIRSNQTGDYNRVKIVQTQDGNTATVTITGDYNGSGFVGAGVAATLAAANGLLSGDITQTGLGNTATLTISGSNSNQFAFLQKGGDGNTIWGEVSGGGSNSAVHVQNGSNNTSTFWQIGSTNAMSVSQ